MRDLIAGEACRVQPDAHRILRSEHVDVAHTLHAAQRVLQVGNEIVADVLVRLLIGFVIDADDQQVVGVRLADDEALLLHLLRQARDLGITLFDTADTYGNGRGESILKQAFTPAERADLVYSSKFGYDWKNNEERRPGHREAPHRFDVPFLQSALDEALDRMGTDHLDVWQMHNVRQSHLEMDDVWTFLDKAKQAGKVRSIGVALGLLLMGPMGVAGLALAMSLAARLPVVGSAGKDSRRSIIHFHCELAAKAMAAARLMLDARGIPYASHVEIGDKAEVITATARRIRANQIVIGTARKNSLTRMIEDSVTNQVLEQTDVPVEIISGEGVPRIERVGVPASIGAMLAALVLALD